MSLPYARIASPFSDERWEEHDGRRFYYLDYDGFKAMTVRDKHLFIVGHRGTGKTTMLKALDWEERVANKQLRDALGGEPFSDGVVGCFMNLRVVALPTFDSWMIAEEAPVYHLVLGSYLRLYWLEEAARATRHIVDRITTYELDVEIGALADAAEYWRKWLANMDLEFSEELIGEHMSLSVLEKTASLLRDHIYNAATFGLVEPKQVASEMNLHRLQDITNRTFKSMANLLRQLEPSIDWTFRICMDEAEYLSSNARLSARTLVRECDSPLILIIAALDDLGVDTIHESVNLSTSDRDVIFLDQRSETDFEALFRGIASERATQWLGRDVEVDLRKLFNRFTLDELLLRQHSESPNLQRITNRWQATLRERPAAFRGSTLGPIYENMVVQGWAPPASFGSPQTRVELSAGARKYTVASYFDILRQCRITHPTYAGWSIVISCMDNSIRDGLRFLDNCYKSSTNTKVSPDDRPRQLEAFLARPIELLRQDSALQLVGRIKVQRDLSTRIQTDQDNAKLMVDFFGILSSTVNFNGGMAAESTKFSVTIPRSSRDMAEILKGAQGLQERFVRTIYLCSREGFMRLESYNPATHEIVFRMHRSLARHHNFSYRRPTHTLVVPWNLVERIWLAPSHAGLKRTARIFFEDRRTKHLQSILGEPEKRLVEPLTLFDSDIEPEEQS